MGSSDTETGVVDCSVGSIVWVRRRNGSWWPGKILGPEELSASHLMSPRSGTPVKLLGREDASVDWYNLEKSKRVKPFRCGEFDDCIERAEASQGMPPKKREKYARREDAILHALELEKQLLETKYGKLGSSSNGKTVKLSDDAGKDSATSSECLAYGNGKHVNSISTGLILRVKEGNQLNGDDDNSDVPPRMRGLQDIGLRPAPSKRKTPLLVASNGSHKPAHDDGVHAPLDGGLTTENVTPNNKKLLDKRKRSDGGQVDESLSKKRDKHLPLVQVLESSAKLPVPHSSQLQSDGNGISPHVSGEEHTGDVDHAKRSKYGYMTLKSENKEILPDQTEIPTSKFEESNHPYLTGLSEENTSGSTEDTETDSSQTDSLELDTDDALHGFSDDAAPIELIPKSLGRSEVHGGHGSTSSDEPDDLALPGEASHPFPDEPISTSVGVSKWQLKGKRNNRNLTRRFPYVSDRKFSKGMYGCDDDDSFERNLRTQMVGYGSRGLDSSRNMNWEDLSWNDQPNWKGGWEETREYYDPVFVGRQFGGRMKSILVDVVLKVQSSYQREHVPMISLMSKLNGKAIVGHPIPVETLENDSSESLLAAADDFHPEALDYDTALQPVWRTARRTANCRVPRPPHLSSTLDGDETADLRYVDHNRKLFGKSSSGPSSHKASIMRKGPSIDRKLVRKPPKKITSSSTQKIRTLSSIATQHKHNSDVKLHGSSSYHMDGLIKPELLPTAVACIPVKLVFSRLYEELVARHQ